MKFRKKTALFVLGIAGLLSFGPEALAKPTGPGAGVEAMLGSKTPAGPAFVYDFGKFRIDALFALGTDYFAGQDLDLNLAGRFFYVLHDAGSADFSIGGGFGLKYFDRGNNNDGTGFFIELGAQIRAFLVTNVALHGTFGLILGLNDCEGVAIAGGVLGTFGVTYFF